MTTHVDAVIAALDTFEPAEVEAKTLARLYEFFQGFDALADLERRRAIPAMLALVERYPEADFGVPGPIVHELEAMGGYEDALRRSLQRQPTMLTVLMVHRILNASLPADVRYAWCTALRGVLSHPETPEWLRTETVALLERQDG
jgi:hypothetical protein